ncbi:uncharacterized protein LOC125487546 isoform X1 [Rhincodon typus]|uniref:uncharacterized protein LOC125487546 isoform X1 n=1 Tax=Rhincodon typus TaxID=259920 RepID=UPI00202DCF7F|nr:uncharacterized protein LOC125487546 isoform X1 [Rhincodon typus]
MGSTYSLAPWGLSSPELYDVSLWLTVVKESGSSPTGARSLLCADSRGSLWCSLWDPTVTPVEQANPQEQPNWTRKQVHSDRVTAVTETEELIVTGSYDRTVRLWDRQSLKQVFLSLLSITHSFPWYTLTLSLCSPPGWPVHLSGSSPVPGGESSRPEPRGLRGRRG